MKMENIPPKSIKRPKPYLLRAEWPDGFSAVIKLEDLRKECPCASCDDERSKKSMSSAPGFGVLQQIKEGQYELEKLEPVGNYAIKATWKDGHDTGLYTWNTLRRIFEKHQLTEDKLKELEEKYG